MYNDIITLKEGGWKVKIDLDEPFILHVILHFQVLLKITSFKEKSFVYLFY